MYESNWEKTKSTSTYHFDNKIVDNQEDVVPLIGKLPNTWVSDLENIIANSDPINWETRAAGRPGFEYKQPELVLEEYDLEQAGMDPKMTLSHMNWQLPDSLQKIADDFALEDCMARVHVQKPGEMWTLHIDKLQKWDEEHPERVVRYFVQLTDWHPGQFWEYGNFHWNRWQAGQVTTFDWSNIPHSTANAGFNPRVTFQLTGILTEKTKQYLAYLATTINI